MTLKRKETNTKKVIFYPGPIHLLWTTGIYYLKLLSENFSTTALLINAKKEDVAKVRMFTEGRVHKIIAFEDRTKLAKHRLYRRLSREVVKEVKPDIVVADHDMYPFEVYLLRQSKIVGGINICYQSGVAEGTVQDQFKRFLGTSAVKFQERYRIPWSWAMHLSRVSYAAREIWYYFVAPALVGSLPFPGKSSAFLQRGRNGMRDSDYSIVFGEREKRIAIEDGVPENRIISIAHPLTWKSSKKLSQQLHSIEDVGRLSTMKTPIVVVFLEHSMDFFRFRKDDDRIITKEDTYRMWELIIRMLSESFLEGTILIKKHPSQAKDDPFVLYIGAIAQALPNAVLITKDIAAMSLAAIAAIIVSETSTVLFTTSLYFTDKFIVSLDLDRKLLGDLYADTQGIIYISSQQELSQLRERFLENENPPYNTKINDDGQKFLDLLFESLDRRKTGDMV